jgi:hypothetical protein
MTKAPLTGSSSLIRFLIVTASASPVTWFSITAARGVDKNGLYLAPVFRKRFINMIRVSQMVQKSSLTFHFSRFEALQFGKDNIIIIDPLKAIRIF